MLASPSGAHAGMRVCQSNLTSHSRRRAQPQPHADFQPLPLLDSDSEAIRHDLMSGATAPDAQRPHTRCAIAGWLTLASQ